ncbi:MAG: chemotaxis response regulator protein-glutamate methylesterase [Acidobacteria bacterium]|nr:chemotaxis response regulator protein-glutamate methylesterase [Acidobacteriota bacterium]
MAAAPRTRVLLVDDSAVVRKLLGDALRRHPDIEVVGGAADPFIARDMILQYKPDVITLDIEMPRMDGLSFLKKLMAHYPVPAIIVSSLTQQGSAASIEALRIGAIDVIGKPGGPHAVGQVADRVAERIRLLRGGSPIRFADRRAAAEGVPAAEPAVRTVKGRGVIAIGASTGGTQAIEAVLTRLPADMPPIVITQHMPAGFTRAFADRLSGVCRMRVVEAAGGEALERGVAYVAPGDHHMTVEAHGVRLLTRLNQDPAVHYQRPSVDVMFQSVARIHGLPVVALLLTGMGTDGADGMVALRRAGAETIAEAEESCVVFGMPKEAIARGGAAHVSSLLGMPALIFECFDRLSRARRAS